MTNIFVGLTMRNEWYIILLLIDKNHVYFKLQWVETYNNKYTNEVKLFL